MNKAVFQANRESGHEYIIRDNIRVPVSQKRPSCFFDPSPNINNHVQVIVSSRKYQQLAKKSASCDV